MPKYFPFFKLLIISDQSSERGVRQGWRCHGAPPLPIGPAANKIAERGASLTVAGCFDQASALLCRPSLPIPSLSSTYLLCNLAISHHLPHIYYHISIIPNTMGDHATTNDPSNATFEQKGKGKDPQDQIVEDSSDEESDQEPEMVSDNPILDQ